MCTWKGKPSLLGKGFQDEKSSIEYKMPTLKIFGNEINWQHTWMQCGLSHALYSTQVCYSIERRWAGPCAIQAAAGVKRECNAFWNWHCNSVCFFLQGFKILRSHFCCAVSDLMPKLFRWKLSTIYISTCTALVVCTFASCCCSPALSITRQLRLLPHCSELTAWTGTGRGTTFLSLAGDEHVAPQPLAGCI